MGQKVPKIKTEVCFVTCDDCQMKNFFFLDESDSDGADKIIFSATRPDGFSFKAYLIDPCKCVNCSKADPKNEDQQSDFEAITFYFVNLKKMLRG